MSDREETLSTEEYPAESTDELIMDKLCISAAGRRAARKLCALTDVQLREVGKEIVKKEKALKMRRRLDQAIVYKQPKVVEQVKSKCVDCEDYPNIWCTTCMLGD